MILTDFFLHHNSQLIVKQGINVSNKKYTWQLNLCRKFKQIPACVMLFSLSNTIIILLKCYGFVSDVSVPYIRHFKYLVYQVYILY